MQHVLAVVLCSHRVVGFTPSTVFAFAVISELLVRGAIVHIVSKVPREFFEESIRTGVKGKWILHEVKTDIGALSTK